MAAMFRATITWLASLVTLPAPMSPVRTAEPDMALSTGWQRSNTAWGPPTITDKVPSMALGCPPLTGASSMSTPIPASLAESSRLTRGAMELMSITTDPRRAPWMMPCSPRTTACTSGELGSMVMMISVRSATSMGVAAASAPAATSSATAGWDRSITTSS